MNVTIPNVLSAGAGLTICVSGTPGHTVEVIVDGDGCSVRLFIPIDANGEGTGFVRSPCLGRSPFVFARDEAGNVGGTPTATI